MSEQQPSGDGLTQGRDEYEMDVDRWANEGLAGGYVTEENENGRMPESTTDTMEVDQS